MSNPALAVRAAFEALRSSAFGSISGAYTALGTLLLHPARVVYIVNTTDVLLTFSLNASTDHFVVAANSFLLLDISSDRTDLGAAFDIPQGTVFYVKGAPTLGSVYLSVIYGAGTN